MRYSFILIILFFGQCTSREHSAYHTEKQKGTKTIRFKNYLGINLFEWDFVEEGREHRLSDRKLKIINAFGTIRHYLDWERIEPQEGHYTFNPSHQGNWNYDAMYEQCKKDSIEVLVCLKNIPDWLMESYPREQRDNENAPLHYGTERDNPRSYLQQARAAFQFAARYGANPDISRNLIKVDTGIRWEGDTANQAKTGLNLIKYMACNNEPDRWWKGKAATQSPEEYAANLSAFYDGHLGEMGKDAGVKNADPDMKVVIGGLSVPDENYISRMVEWCRKHRGLKQDGSVNLCFDIISYHLYPNENKIIKNGKSMVGVAPEKSILSQTAENFKRMAGNTEIWITETGYDVGYTPQRAIAIGRKLAAITQADWNLRTALLYARLGVDRVMFYMLNDVNINSPLPYHSSGFVDKNYQPRAAWYYTRQVKSLLGDFHYVKTFSQDPIVDLYAQNEDKIYVLTVPTQEGRSISYELNIEKATKAIIYELSTNSEQMKQRDAQIVQGKITLQVSETPVFVRVFR